ncbi:A disintegrin and metalloproteinase with thrombospondin motifs adt-1-like [Euwallacea fornicatus]|uniref:A disintegrin and metalloproteinase with thrombospondin motifs adt-1-like n=1 Tax=Euwallacea fornicatus TaxID=995702 RepID=UPI00338E1217
MATEMFAVSILFVCAIRTIQCNVPYDGEPERIHHFMTLPELMHYFGTKDVIPDYDVVYLPEVTEQDASMNKLRDEEIEYSFSVFQRPMTLKLKRNSEILGTAFKTFIHEENEITQFNETPAGCHYLHRDQKVVAAFSICNPRTVQGLIFTENSTFEIQPLTSRLHRLVKRQADKTSPHIVKKAIFNSDLILDEVFPIAGSIWGGRNEGSLKNVEDISEEIFENFPEYYLQPRGQIMTVELALFFDEAAYKIFAPYLEYSDKKLQNMLLAYINGVQALYHHPSLGTTLELVLVRLDIIKKQPREMPHYNGERSKLLDSFCQYQSSLNPSNDGNPEHWDMALYVSGLDFFAYENGRKNGATMGLATVGGVCLDKYACVIAEFGTTNVFGKPYPSAGFTSVYVLAHEIGHNLGMHHDNSGNSCPKEGYIMSPSRGTNGETLWSSCSAEVMTKLSWAKCLKDVAKPLKGHDHSRFLDIPGRIYTAKKQCEILLRDKDAAMSPSQSSKDICYNLQCKSPHRSGFYFAGPALDGTPCGSAKYCYGGQCTSKQPPTPIKITPGGWSNWKNGSCSSGCIQNSKGMHIITRECNNPVPVNTDQGCEGVNRQFGLCKDDTVCNAGRIPVVEYASMECRTFSNLLPELDPNGVGLQAPHEDDRVWTSCAIFCKRKNSGAFYTPRIELNDIGVSSYFPDGTWCHRDPMGMNYYCMNHHCLPENFKFTKNHISSLDDIPFPQNARPHHKPLIPDHLKNYFALSPNGLPIQTSFKTSDIFPQKEEEWESKDYVELPSLQRRFGALVEQIDDLNLV